jgi:uncharacterized membrane protein
MSIEQPRNDELTQALPRRVPAWVYGLGIASVAVGGASFGAAVSAPDPAPAWRALLVNFLFWSSVAQGAFTWAVTFRLSRTTWSAPFERIGQSALGFLGVSVLVFIALFFGRQFYLPWVHADLGDRSKWLNVPFVFLRDGIGLLAMFLLAAAFVRARLNDDVRQMNDSDEAADGRLRRRDRQLSLLGVSLALLYAVVATLIGFDLVMSLVPGWFSALFGWYYLIGGLYAGMAALVITAIVLQRWLGLTIRRQQFQDLGNLLMAFAMVMTYFFFAQALSIWYENLPTETVFAIPRIHLQPWRTLSWVAVWVCFLGPFCLLVVREMKENPRTLAAVASLVFAAMWFERYLLVAPSLAPKASGFPILVPLVGVGFFGMLILTAAPLLARLPMFGRLDAQVRREREAWQ